MKKDEAVQSYPDPMQTAVNQFNWLLDHGYKIVFNRIDGLFVFNWVGDLIKAKDRHYSNNNQKTVTVYTQKKYLLSSRTFSQWRLICLCLYFGKFNKETGDYVITGNKYKGI